MLWQIDSHISQVKPMNDPSSNELKAEWVHAYDAQQHPIIHTVSIVRAPGEDVAHWQKRFTDQIAADIANPDTKPYGT